MDTLTLFSKNLNQRSLTPRWLLTPCLLRSHVWLYPRIIVSKSHDNTSMYVDTVINFAKYHIHTYTYILHTTYRMSDHIVSYWTQFRQDKKMAFCFTGSTAKKTPFHKFFCSCMCTPIYLNGPPGSMTYFKANQVLMKTTGQLGLKPSPCASIISYAVLNLIAYGILYSRSQIN